MSRLLHSWVSEQALRRPEAPALALGEARLSYGELEALSDRLAQALWRGGLRRGERVCLLMPKTPLAIAALLAIYKAGGIYVPLDPRSPPERLVRIAARCASQWLLAAGDVCETLRQVIRTPTRTKRWAVGWLEESAPEGAIATRFGLNDVLALPSRRPPVPCRSRDVAHIMFTSGSTGTPKGVAITHENVVSFIEWATAYFEVGRDERLSGHAPLHFDLSMLDLFVTFATGAELHIVPARCSVLPNLLAEWMRGSRLTQWFSVPAVLEYLAGFDAVRQGDFPHLRRIMWCGEVLSTRTLRYWMQRVPHAKFTNLYGPTETTIASSYHTVPECPDNERTEIPIGVACEGERLYVLDQQLQPVGEGEIGELYISGAGLSPGYWWDPAATSRSFIYSPESGRRLYRTGDLARRSDGLVYFVGRTDSQIKSRGYRIELGEVESALHSLDCLRESAVVAAPSQEFDGMAICCAYVAAYSDVSAATLRSALSRLLPDYMLPSRWQAYTALPRSATGKIDRKRIREVWERYGADSSRAT